MSSPSLGYPTSGGRRLSVSSQGSHREAPAADLNDDAKRLSSSVGSVSHREPIRSFIHGSDRGYLAPLDSALSARSVREETAELANYVLSDKKDGRGSPLLRRARSASSHAGRRSRTISTPELASPEISPAGPAGPADTINEVSEPPSPDAVDEQAAGGPSMLTTMLRRSRPDTRFPVAPKQEERRENGVSAEDGKYAAVGTAKAPSPEPRPLLSHRDTDEEASETSPLLAVRSRESHRSHVEGHADGHGVVDLEGQKYLNPKKWLGRAAESIRGTGSHLVSVIPIINKPKRWDRRALWQNVFVAPVVCLPAVTVGVLLNILDALSYGMILFPLGNPIFSNLGSAGISIFYVSTIIAQLTFSCGSIFKGGIGSELIEVVPFFHNMAGTITDVVGQDKPDAVIATVITSYALSSMLTGAVFFLMGQFKFGYLVGFIPRHILIGCIGGVGWFLIATGFEVTARMDGSFNYDLETLKRLVQADTIPLWIIPLTLAVILFYAQSRVTSKYFLPLYILIIPAGFYALAAALDRLNPDKLRDNGWVFDGPPAGEPWWYFYTLYKFRQVHWGAIAQCIPAMFALTFFSCLHVPINVPTLALNTGEDDANLDHELKLHGYSNLLSGLAGSIQNYLVYSNSLFFMRSGGNSRLAGIELAIFTFVVMVVGPPVIGFIPVMMVGTLIFVLGFELLLEAVWQPRRKLKSLEYITVFAIVLVMGTYDFVVGIGVGILLAFVSLIIQTSRVSAVRASYSGDVVGSTVRRNPTQQHYLRQVGHQIEIIKLSGYLFFGTIVSVEDKIRGLIAEEEFRGRPFTFLILDLWLVTGLDYSAAEVFNTISRLLNSRDIESVISGVDPEHGLGRTLRAVGLGEDGIEVKLLPELNSALEYCENELLKTFYANEEDPLNSGGAPTGNLDVPNQRSSLGQPADMLGSSPRRVLLHEAARKSLGHVQVKGLSRWQSFKEPLRLMLQIFHEVSDRNEDFWFRAVGYFRRSEYAAGTVLFRRGEPAEGFYLVESGILRAEYDLPQGWLFESIVAGTTCGELPFFSETERTATCVVERDCVVWLMDRESWARLQKEEPDVAQELLRISLKLTSERLSSITSYVLTMAG